MKLNLYLPFRQAVLFHCMIVALFCSFGLNAQIITTVCGTGVTGYFGNGGPASFAMLNAPGSLAFDGSGNLYINDQRNNCVRKIDRATNIITTVAGKGNDPAGFSGDNGPATAAHMRLNWGIAIDGTGNLYITDQLNYRVRKVNTAGIITTFAGNGFSGTGGDGGPATAAQFIRPLGIAVDGTGNVYIGDADARTIRKVNTAGIISTYAGIGDTGYGGDGGPAIAASFRDTYGLATDAAGNLYICDGGNNCVRRIDPSGIITTIAGTGIAGYNGDNGPATNALLRQPTGVTVDGAGNIYISDFNNHRIRKINPTGIIKTIAGTGLHGFSGDGGPSVIAKIASPVGVAVDANQNAYFSDFDNVRIRKISRGLFFAKGNVQQLEVCEGVSSSIDSSLKILDSYSGFNVVWALYSGPHHGTATLSHTETTPGGPFTPTGLIYTSDAGYSGADTFTYTISNGYDVDTTTVRVTVNNQLDYAGVITGPDGVCVGSSILLTDTTGNGTWSISNLNAIVVNGVVTGASPGLDTVYYTIGNACGTISTSKVISIYPLPDPGSITGAKKLCIGSSIQLSASVPGGSWNITNPAATISATGKVTGVYPGADTVVYTVSDAFCAASTIYTVTVDPFPTADIALSQHNVCVGSVIAVSGEPAGGAWVVRNANAAISAGRLTGLKEGIDTIHYITSNFCGIDTATEFIKINPLPAVPFVTYIESMAYATKGYPAYQWLLNKTLIPDAVADSYHIVATGFYSVMVSNSFGCSVVSPEELLTGCNPDDITIYPNPSQSIIHVKWCKKLIINILTYDGKVAKSFYDVNEIDMDDLPNEVYLLVIADTNGNKIRTEKIVKISK